MFGEPFTVAMAAGMAITLAGLALVAGGRASSPAGDGLEVVEPAEAGMVAR